MIKTTPAIPAPILGDKTPPVASLPGNGGDRQHDADRSLN